MRNIFGVNVSLSSSGSPTSVATPIDVWWSILLFSVKMKDSYVHLYWEKNPLYVISVMYGSSYRV